MMTTTRATSDQERIREYYAEIDNDHRGYDCERGEGDERDDLGDDDVPKEDDDAKS